MENRKNSLKLFREHSAYVADNVNNGIEQNRKGYLSIKVIDENKNPIKGARVTAVLKNHEFKFGADLKNPDKNGDYGDSFKKLFNLANIQPDWIDDSPNCSSVTDLSMDYCRENDIEPRFQPLASEGMFPKRLYGKSSDEVKSQLGRSIKEISEKYSSKVRTVEAIRGMFGYDENVSFYNDNDYVAWCLKQAEKYMSCNQIVINELSHVWYDGLGVNRDRYYMAIERLLSENVKIDAIGMEFRMSMSAREQFLDSMRVHMYVGWWPKELEEYRKAYDPVHLYKTLNKYSDFNRPIHITGVMIPAYTDVAEDEEIQAELLKYLYSIWFSHKNVEQIIYRSFIDGNEDSDLFGGLMRSDLSKKPAFNVLDSLINKEWRTEEAFVTDGQGVGAFKGFYGDYELKIETAGKVYMRTVEHSKKREISLCPVWGKKDIEIVI